MLVLSRKKDEVICIGDRIRLTVVAIAGNSVRLGIEVPREMTVLREELSSRQPDAATDGSEQDAPTRTA